MEFLSMISLVAESLIGMSILLAGILGSGLITMWLSSFYILSTWHTSHRLVKRASSSTTTSNVSSSSPCSRTSSQLKKINSFITPMSTTDILLN